ncbi:hypothetical protein SAMN05421548_102146 [Paraburkholderia lycopersici]|uniref:Uncharacterized protein n=1 Tax=Paraburkholderia lycopersici TaxID=416944 RepID=A0A1G6HBJ8_9BURK|nr:hypothetical protein SAMN05421548_102146 [Paraburkholderia lycopersici]
MYSGTETVMRPIFGFGVFLRISPAMLVIAVAVCARGQKPAAYGSKRLLRHARSRSIDRLLVGHAQ